MDGEERVLVPFQPEFPPHTNGHSGRLRRTRLRPPMGTVFGFLLGALLATNVVGRLQMLNLLKVGWWGRPVLVALAAGALVGLVRRERAEVAAVGGAIAGAASLWVVYGLARLSTPVLFVEESFPLRLARDLVLLLAWGATGGAAAAAFAGTARARVMQMRARGPRR